MERQALRPSIQRWGLLTTESGSDLTSSNLEHRKQQDIYFLGVWGFQPYQSPYIGFDVGNCDESPRFYVDIVPRGFSETNITYNLL